MFLQKILGYFASDFTSFKGWRARYYDSVHAIPLLVTFSKVSLQRLGKNLDIFCLSVAYMVMTICELVTGECFHSLYTIDGM